jgi:hypothetical protein
MDASSFRFTMTMPGDARLVGAVRDLTAHAAKYAKLTEAAAAELADQVAGAAAISIEAIRVKDAPIELQFARDGERLEVMIACDVDGSNTPPASSSAHGVTVAWSRRGGRQTCLIAQRVSAEA